jgi:hypothetical protein
MENHNHSHASEGHGKAYQKILIMVVLSFVSMYILMYAMVDSFANVFPNVNQFYMAGLMTSPMVIIELAVMWGMYRNKRLNAILIVLSAVALVTFYACIRQQAAVADKQFLRSMIPHHAAAVLMVEKASVTDPEIKELCRNIISSQQKEIEQMKAKLKELEK